MSRSHALCRLSSVKKQKHDFHFFRSMYNKTIIRFDKGYQPQPSDWLVTLTSTLIILDITKTSSNNCFSWRHFTISVGAKYEPVVHLFCDVFIYCDVLPYVYLLFCCRQSFPTTKTWCHQSLRITSFILPCGPLVVHWSKNIVRVSASGGESSGMTLCCYQETKRSVKK